MCGNRRDFFNCFQFLVIEICFRIRFFERRKKQIQIAGFRRIGFIKKMFDLFYRGSFFAETFRFGKNSVKNAVDIICVKIEYAVKIRHKKNSHSLRNDQTFFEIVGNAMRLQTVFHLQTMFKPPQKFIRFDQFGQFRFGQ